MSPSELPKLNHAWARLVSEGKGVCKAVERSFDELDLSYWPHQWDTRFDQKDKHWYHAAMNMFLGDTIHVPRDIGVQKINYMVCVH